MVAKKRSETKRKNSDILLFVPVLFFHNVKILKKWNLNCILNPLIHHHIAISLVVIAVVFFHLHFFVRIKPDFFLHLCKLTGKNIATISLETMILMYNFHFRCSFKSPNQCSTKWRGQKQHAELITCGFLIKRIFSKREKKVQSFRFEVN